MKMGSVFRCYRWRQHQFTFTEEVIINQTPERTVALDHFYPATAPQVGCGVEMRGVTCKRITFFMHSPSHRLDHFWFNEVNLLDWVEFRNTSDSKKITQGTSLWCVTFCFNLLFCAQLIESHWITFQCRSMKSLPHMMWLLCLFLTFEYGLNIKYKLTPDNPLT